jgi:hypothetical protein
MSVPKLALGRLEKVQLREIWESESGAFTPWLAQPGNLQLLGESIGIALELDAQEKDVGPFRADILCKDADSESDHWILIENQLERTDHGHLGQLLTYAAGLKAVTIVWIARAFTEEHRAALDWLNEITDERFRFFGLEVEAWRIGNSPPAPKFNVVSKPNDWSREVAGGTARAALESLSDVRRLQLDFWLGFRAYAADHAERIRPQKASPQHWMTMGIGRSGFHLSGVISTWEELRAELVITAQQAKKCLAILKAQREEIEKAVGEPLEWYSQEDTKSCRIFVQRSAALDDRNAWPEYHRWLTDRLERLHEVFQPRVRAIDLDALAEQGDLTE